jgi:hypothetical protein
VPSPAGEESRSGQKKESGDGGDPQEAPEAGGGRTGRVSHGRNSSAERSA